jgi:hypothetical protein
MWAVRLSPTQQDTLGVPFHAAYRQPDTVSFGESNCNTFVISFYGAHGLPHELPVRKPFGFTFARPNIVANRQAHDLPFNPSLHGSRIFRL